MLFARIKCLPVRIIIWKFNTLLTAFYKILQEDWCVFEKNYVVHFIKKVSTKMELKPSAGSRQKFLFFNWPMFSQTILVKVITASVANFRIFASFPKSELVDVQWRNLFEIFHNLIQKSSSKSKCCHTNSPITYNHSYLAEKVKTS